MHAVMRYYAGPGASELFDVLEQHITEIEALIRDVPGFFSYALVRLEGAGRGSVTVCDDKAGTDESIRRAADWIRQNVANVTAPPPSVSEGKVILGLTR